MFFYDLFDLFRTLPNGERIPIPPNVRVVVEVQDRKYALLATASRWGTVCFTEDCLTPQMLLKHYLARLRHVPLEEVKEDTVRTPSATNIQFQKEVAGILKPYFSPGGLVVRALEHAATRLEHINFTRFWALYDLFSMLDQSVRTILNYNCSMFFCFLFCTKISLKLIIYFSNYSPPRLSYGS
jgi:dynein heavy chain 1